jgi:C1A family cysteine protease
MNEIKSMFSVLILILTIFMVTLQSVSIEVNGSKLGNIEDGDDMTIPEDSQVIQPILESIKNPGSEQVKQSKSRSAQRELLSEFSPLEDLRINDYVSHILTAEEATELKSKVGIRESNKNYNLLFNGLGTGLAPPTQAEWDAMVGNVEVVESTLGSSFPSSLDHSTSTYFPPVRSQASQGSCAAWATTYYAATYSQSKDNDWTQTSSGNNNQIMSPAWTYNKANYGYDSGSYTWTNFYVLADLGGATWSTMPYNQFEDLYWGDETAWREAPEYRFGKMKWTYPQEIEVLKAWLNDGFVLPFALDAGEYSNLGSGDNIISSTEYDSSIANHANTVVGYDDEKKVDGDIGAFKIVNSWGSSWGSSWSGNGYYWMTYKAFAELTNPVIMFYDKIDYDPTLLATWNITGSCSRKADITLGVGDPNLPNGSTTPYWLGGTHDLPKFMCLDITEFRDSVGLSSFFLEVDSGALNGSISSFRLELYENGYSINGSTLKSPESPEVTRTNPCTVNNSISGFQIKIDTPDEGQWYKGIIQSIGVAQDPVEKTVLYEDFEGDFQDDWEVGDSDSAHGIDTWDSTTTRSYKGFRSGWCAAVAEPLFEENFDSNDTIPDGWLNFSEGPDYQKWNVTSI